MKIQEYFHQLHTVQVFLSCNGVGDPTCVGKGGAQKTIALCCAMEWVVMDEAAVNSSWRAAVF